MDSPQVGSPSAGGSPAAAAATPGVEGVDGMEVARRMVQAAEAAALAAQAATRAVEGVSRTSTDDSKQWWRLLPKPPTFEHTNRESEIAAWREWSWAFEQYVASIDAKFADDIEQLRANPNQAVDPVDFTDTERQRNHFLYSLLSSLLRQRPLLVVRNVTFRPQKWNL